MVWKPDVTVAAVIEHEGRFLMVEELIGGRRVLNQPAGHLEDGETLIQAVIRETLEETAWAFHPQWLIGTYLWRSPRSGDSTLRFAFTGNGEGPVVDRSLDAVIIATHWMRREQIVAEQARLRSPVVLRCLHDYLAGQRVPLAAVANMTPED
jgi:8-oxo-dGTP pyrophosphatase MutT (NUDIX family)